VRRRRLDEELVARGFYATRARARDAVKRGTVSVEGEIAAKVSQLVSSDSEITISDPLQNYVSRAALKLIHALDHFGIEVKGKHALDLGASTGGFTQVLLERGAVHVTAIDVGHGQMASEISSDSRVTLIEGLNARDLTREHLSHAIELIVCDVSFISLKLALPPALDLAEQGASLVVLIKPQFEAGRERIGKGGIVGDPSVHHEICEEMAAFVVSKSWEVNGIVPSPISGGDGNKEFLLAATIPPLHATAWRGGTRDARDGVVSMKGPEAKLVKPPHV
jgi:23S rRNA (cytidine1920-2'-O)/16S rRNA (cytidine1409-2'-O)-methyltransferase